MLETEHLFVVVRLEDIDDAKYQESNRTAECDCNTLASESKICHVESQSILTIAHTDPPSDSSATNHSTSGTKTVSELPHRR